MGIYAIKPKFQKVLTPVVDFCLKNNISADVLNVAGLVSAGALAFCIALAPSLSPWLLLAIPPLALIRTACNALDGLVSRAKGEASAWGQFVNETVDRVSDAAIFLAFLFIPSVDPALVAVAVAVILLNSYIAIASQATGGPRIYLGLVGKADRMIYLSILAIAIYFSGQYAWSDYFLLFIIITTAVSFAQRLHFAYQSLNRLGNK